MPRPAAASPPARRPPTSAKFDHILESATREFCEKGYEGASIRDIARRSRVSLAGLYYYVESKEKLLYLIQKHCFATLIARLKERLEAAGSDPEQRLRLLICNHLDFFLRHREAMKVLSHESDSLTPPYQADVAELKRAYYRLACAIVEDLKRERKLRNLNTRLAVLSLFGMMNWIYTWHKPRLDPDSDALAEHIAGLFLGGIEAEADGAARLGRGSNDRPRRT
ncbi:MAG: TetR/AcrR family transcriptional regulator [Acidobacteria bacterium]|nr:TetR/AcrR family transcriptional regulator [Acidobacteriota bacterium]